LIVTSGITIQFGAKPLFENISVKFGEGNRYGLIGANGCGKSTFMKILGGDLESSAGSVAVDRNERVGKLRQDQFAYEDARVLDVVLMGHEEMWQAMTERDVAGGGFEQAGENFHQRRLARAVGTDQAVAVALAELDGDVFEQRLGAELYGEAGGDDQDGIPRRKEEKGRDSTAKNTLAFNYSSTSYDGTQI
jgi:ATPase subunit of ABC transporter with duplicated ATPase domains